MEILNKKQKIILIIIVVFILLFIGYYIINKVNNSSYINLETEDISESNIKKGQNLEGNISYEEEKENSTKVVIHATGEIKKQGIVEVKEGSRISDVIKAAGGATDKADLSKVNLAYIVEDGQKIYIPSVNDKEDIKTVDKDAGDGVVKENKGPSSPEKVNINTASQTELETLNGIGTSTALKIINYRNENGSFKKIEDLKNVPGIGDSKFEGIKGNITTE